MSDFNNRFWYVDDDNPLILGTRGSTFGGMEDFLEGHDNGRFAFGGSSIVRAVDGEEIDEDEMEEVRRNPNNYRTNDLPYVAVLPEFVERGIVKPGQRISITNRANGVTAIGIARDIGMTPKTKKYASALNRGIDMAPHLMKELGATTDDELVVDFRPVSEDQERLNDPFTLSGEGEDYSLSDVTTSPQAPSPGEVFNPKGDGMSGISTLTAIGSREGDQSVDLDDEENSEYTPDLNILKDAEPKIPGNQKGIAALSRKTPPKIKQVLPDGTVEYEGGIKVYPNDIVEIQAGEAVWQYLPGADKPQSIQKKDDTITIERIGEDGSIRTVLVNKETGVDVKDLGVKRKGDEVDANLAKEAREIDIDITGKDAPTVHRELIEKRNALGLLSPTQQQAAANLMNKMNSDVAYKDVQNIKQGYLSVMDGALTGTSAGDLAMINGYQRMIDPGATVREGDVKLIQSAQGVLQKISNLPAVLAGQAQLTPEMRRQLKAMADTVYKTRVINFERSSGKTFRKRAKMFNLPEDAIDLDFGIEVKDETPSSATQQQAGATPSPTPNQAATPTQGKTSPSDQEAYERATATLNNPQSTPQEKQLAEAVLSNMRARKLIP